MARAMHRDPTLRTRNALVIPGVLLVLLCLAGIVYAQALRGDDVECEDGRQVVFAGTCRSATLLLVIPLAIGLLLMGLGMAKRPKGSCHLGHGTTATTVLAVLIALVVLPLLAAGYITLTETADAPYLITYGEVDYSIGDILAGVGALMLLALIPYAALYFGTMRPPRCCRDKACFEPCFCDEVTEEEAPAPAPIPTFGAVPLAPNEQAEVTTTPWTGSTRVQPLPAPIPPSQPALMTPAPTPPEPSPVSWPDATVAEAQPVAAEPEPAEEPEAKAAPKRKMTAPKTRKVTRKSSK